MSSLPACRDTSVDVRCWVLSLWFASFSVTGCRGGDAAPARAPDPPPTGAAGMNEGNERAWGIYRSKRFDATIPLPDGRGWRIDDHSAPWLVATHEATSSRLTFAISFESELMNRQKCEERTLPKIGLDPQSLITLDEGTTTAPDGFDTRVWVALRAGASASDPLEGHVLAFGGFIRKCMFFHFETRVLHATDEPKLSARLAVARTRILPRLTLLAFDEIRRRTPG